MEGETLAKVVEGARRDKGREREGVHGYNPKHLADYGGHFFICLAVNRKVSKA